MTIPGQADFNQLKQLNMCHLNQLVVTLQLYVNTIYDYAVFEFQILGVDWLAITRQVVAIYHICLRCQSMKSLCTICSYLLRL